MCSRWWFFMKTHQWSSAEMKGLAMLLTTTMELRVKIVHRSHFLTIYGNYLLTIFGSKMKEYEIGLFDQDLNKILFLQTSGNSC